MPRQRHASLRAAVALATVMMLFPATSIPGQASDTSPRSNAGLKARLPETKPPAATIKGTTFTKPRREVFGYVNAANIAASDVGYSSWDFNSLTTIAFFGLHVNSGDGSF